MKTVDVLLWFPYLLNAAIVFMIYLRYAFCTTSIKYLAHLLVAFLFFQLVAKMLIDSNFVTAQLYKVGILFYHSLTCKVFYHLFIDSKYQRRVKTIWISGMVVFVIQYLIAFQNDYNLSNSVLVLNLCTTVLSLLFFNEILRVKSIPKLTKEWSVLMVSGFFIYALCSSAFWMVELVAFALGRNPYNTYPINSMIYTLELLLFFWAGKVYFSVKKSKIDRARSTE